MIQLNVISRISLEKNFFFDLLFAVDKVNKAYPGNRISIRFIGEILDKGVHFSMLRAAKLLELTDSVEFTCKSIPMKELANRYREEYFINLSVGDFIGYSGLECIDLGFKTLFYNIDENYASFTKAEYCFCPDVEAMTVLLTDLLSRKEDTDARLVSSNKRVASRFRLDAAEKELLVSILNPEQEG